MAGLRLIDALVVRMKHLQDRQGVISQNIANADTPGYRAREVKAPDFSSLIKNDDGTIHRPTVALSNSMRALGRSKTATIAAETWEEKPNGNNVSLEDQVMAMGQVQSDYQAAASLYRKSMGLLKIAIGR